MRYEKEFYQKLLDGDRFSWAEITPILKKCSKIGASKAGVDYMHEDIYCELLRVLFTSLLIKIDPAYNIEPILIETTRRIGLAVSRNEPFENSVGISSANFESPEHFESHLAQTGAAITAPGPEDISDADPWVIKRQQAALKRMGLS